jgi:hypothetical protein
MTRWTWIHQKSAFLLISILSELISSGGQQLGKFRVIRVKSGNYGRCWKFGFKPQHVGIRRDLYTTFSGLGKWKIFGKAKFSSCLGGRTFI